MELVICVPDDWILGIKCGTIVRVQIETFADPAGQVGVGKEISTKRHCVRMTRTKSLLGSLRRVSSRSNERRLALAKRTERCQGLGPRVHVGIARGPWLDKMYVRRRARLEQLVDEERMGTDWVGVARIQESPELENERARSVRE